MTEPMINLSVKHLTYLKQLVLEKAGIEKPLANDCRIISAAIFKETRQLISETTLKRIYGFAYSRYHPSVFTVNAMCNYCGYSSWEDFCEKQDLPGPVSSGTWDTIRKNTLRTTHL